MKKKIIFVTQALWIGGIETALINLLNYIDYNKYEVTLLTIRGVLELINKINSKCRVLSVDREKTFSFKERYKYKRLYQLTEQADNPSKLHKAFLWLIPAIKYVENRLYIRYIRRCLSGEHFDTCIIYSDVTAETAIRAVSADRFLMYYHHGAMRHVYHDEIAYRKCDKIIAVSKNQADELRRFVPEAADKMTVIHNLTDVDEIRKKAELSTEEVFDSQRFHIVTVGRVSHEKGMDIAVQVCAQLVNDGFENICWWIVGDGPAMQEIRALVNKLGVESYIKLVGMKENPYPYIRQADLYVQPSRFEGYPMTLLEAIALGQLVISTNNNGAKEIINDGYTGLLCPLEVLFITKTIEQMIDDSERREEMKKNAREIDFEQRNNNYIKQLEVLF